MKQVGMGAEHMAKPSVGSNMDHSNIGEQCPWSSEGEGTEREAEAQEPGRGHTVPGLPSPAESIAKDDPGPRGQPMSLRDCLGKASQVHHNPLCRVMSESQPGLAGSTSGTHKGLGRAEPGLCQLVI